MDILGATLRIYVDDLDKAIPFYEGLAGGEALRFERGGVQVAAIGCFLLMSGPESQLEVLRKVSATVAVSDVVETHRVLSSLGADSPAPSPASCTADPDPPALRRLQRRAPARALTL
ncbi:VOC family protein, partial [Streptomyces tendae]